MAGDDETARANDHLSGMQAEPLLPVEKKLIAFSLLLGLALLGLLVWTGNSSVTFGQ
jgi:hypothetical protein